MVVCGDFGGVRLTGSHTSYELDAQKAAGASAGTIEWQGRQFPRGEGELPEAFDSTPGMLPHLHPDHLARYPRAICEHHPGDSDPPSDDHLEKHGEEIGRGGLTLQSRKATPERLVHSGET